jgi:hypothetical protein
VSEIYLLHALRAILRRRAVGSNFIRTVCFECPVPRMV